MLKKRIKYTDYDGNQREEDFYFNLTKAEIAELELSTEGGLEQLISKIIDAKDTSQIIKFFKKIILMSYGEESLDGKRFIKDEELTKEFTQTEAYSELFMELASDENAASNFINGIIPTELKQTADLKITE